MSTTSPNHRYKSSEDDLASLRNELHERSTTNELELESISVVEKFINGRNLNYILTEIEAINNEVDKTRNYLNGCIYDILKQAIATLQLTSATELDSDSCEQEQLLQEQSPNIVFCLQCITQLQSLYLFENYDAALELASTAKNLIQKCAYPPAIAEYYFYYSLTLTTLHSTATQENQELYWTGLIEHLNYFQEWISQSTKHEHQYLLIQAELARLSGDILTAMELYDRAITSAHEQEFIQHQALSNELAAKFYRQHGRHKIVEVYIADAYVAYQQWGAVAKVNHLEQHYSQLITHPKTSIEADRFYQDLERSLQSQIKLTEAYSRFVPREFLQLLGKDSVVDVELGDQVQLEMSVLFADICNFTTLSEQMTPKENFKFINSYFGYMESVIADNGGFIDKYIGDSIMALFNGEANDAVDAAIAMIHNLADYNQRRVELSQSPIKIGIGINTGSLMLGTVGGANRMDSTVISDAVNLSARIEKLTRDYGVTLLITHQTLTKLHHPEQYSIRMIDQVKVKGKSELVTVYEVFDADPPDIQAGKRLTAKPFTEALSLFNARRYREATRLLETCLDQNPQDKVARIYLERCLQSGLHLMQEL